MAITSRSLFLAALLAVLSASTPALAEDPLFASADVLDISLTGPFARIDRERDKEQKYEGRLSYTDAEGSLVTLDAKLSVRGNFRLQKSVCRYSQLWVNLKKKQVRGTLFAGQDKLKLVVQCQKSARYAEYLAREEQAYRMFELLSDVSLGTRRLSVEYVDSEKEARRTADGFFIEHQKRLAWQHEMTVLKAPQATRALLDPQQSALVGLFMYMVSNTDYSMIAAPPGDSCCHNIKVLEDGNGALYPVPYDFDSTGFINASYAEPTESVGQRNVRQRIYRGYCFADEHMAYARELMAQKRDQILSIANDPRFQSEKSIRRSTAYLGEFFDIIGDSKQYQRKVIGECR